MKNFYFTFGSGHITKAGKHLSGYWIRVVGEEYWTARDKFVKEFTSIYMQAPDKFAFQYEEHDFKTFWCPYGEFKVIN